MNTQDGVFLGVIGVVLGGMTLAIAKFAYDGYRLARAFSTSNQQPLGVTTMKVIHELPDGAHCVNCGGSMQACHEKGGCCSKCSHPTDGLASLAQPEHTRAGIGHTPPVASARVGIPAALFTPEAYNERARMSEPLRFPGAPDAAQQYAEPHEPGIWELELAAFRTSIEVLRRLSDSQRLLLNSALERVALCESALRMLTSALAEDAGTDTALYVLATMRDAKGTKFNAGKRVDCPTVGEVRAATIEVPRDCELLEVAVWESRGHLCSVKVGTEQIGFGQIPAVACPMVVAKGTLVTVQVMRTGE